MHRYNLAFAIQGAIDRDAGIIRGVSVITEGATRGHKAAGKPMRIDGTTLAQVRDAASQFQGGLKVKMNHGTGADAIIGALRSFRADGPQLRADLHILKSSPMRERILEMAAEMPDSFGLSISFTGAPEEANDHSLARCIEIYSCDIVDQPAANPTGLFSAQIDTTPQSNMIIETPEYLALVTEHKALSETSMALKTDLEAATAAKTELTAQLASAKLSLDAAENSITELKAKLEEQDTAHKAALAEFDAKVAAESQRQLAALGTAPVALGAPDMKGDAELYDKFKLADPVTARTMLSDPSINNRIRQESARRNK